MQNEIQINTYDDLVKFLSRNDIDFAPARQIAQTFLNVLIFETGDKEQLIKSVEKYIDDYGSLPANAERPIFLDLDIDVIE